MIKGDQEGPGISRSVTIQMTGATSADCKVHFECSAIQIDWVAVQEFKLLYRGNHVK